MSASLRAAWMRAEDWMGVSNVEMQGREEGERTYVVEHFVAGFEAFGCEEIFEGFLLLAGDV